MAWYQVDTRDLEPEESIGLFRRLVRWAAGRGDRFEISFQTGVYDDPNQVRRLRGLGQPLPPRRPGDALSRLFARMFDKDSELIGGVPGPAFVEEITGSAAPARVVSGHESPVESIVIFRGESPFYASYDYGTVQTLDLIDEEKQIAGPELESLGLHPARLLTVRGPKRG